jgi:ribosomal protein S18 acetylase RimI-like enzyme
MIKATKEDKNIVIQILAAAFNNNQSVNYIVKQDANTKKRIEILMDYCFESCYAFGEVLLNEDKTACALIMYNHQKKTNLASIIRNIKLIMGAIGIMNIKKAIAREALIKKVHPVQMPFTYLWYIGVAPEQQQQGIGTQLLQELLAHATKINMPVYLETSVKANGAWYEKNNFTLSTIITKPLPYKLYCYYNNGNNAS